MGLRVSYTLSHIIPTKALRRTFITILPMRKQIRSWSKAINVVKWQSPCLPFPGSYKVSRRPGSVQPAHSTLPHRADMGVGQVCPRPQAPV